MLDAVRDVVAAHLPDYRIDSVERLGEGQENVAYELNGELIVRFSKEQNFAQRARRVEREVRLLHLVAGVSPLSVPEPCFAAAERGAFAYFKLPGVPLLELSITKTKTKTAASRSPHATSIAARLGELLSALHAVPVDLVADLVDLDDQPLDEWRQDAANIFVDIAAHLPVIYRGRVEVFLGAPPPPAGYTTVFSHNDLGIEHVLIDPATWTISGIIDWSDAAIDDPAYDFGLIYRDLGPAALDAALAAYRPSADRQAALRTRALFYARCSVLEDLAYGLNPGQERYARNSLAALAWLFSG